MESLRCRVCKRWLKNPLSVELGIGPVCRAKGSLDLQGEFDFMSEQVVGKIKGWNADIVCSCNENGIQTNVPRRIVNHSPDGFEWGYGGSGPADLALNILSIFLGQEEAWRYHQDFKWAFIATMPHEGGVIKREDILNWLKEKTEEV
jgi:hypothetical protein